MTSVLIKRGNLDTDTHTGSSPCKNKGRDCGGAVKTQGMPKIASEPPEARGEAWNRFSLTVLRRNQPC